MRDVIDRIADALTRMEAEGRRPSRLLIGNLEATELEARLYRPSRPGRTRTYNGFSMLFDDGEEEYAPKLPLDMGPATIFGVPVGRVDQESLIGVIAEGYE